MVAWGFVSAVAEQLAAGNVPFFFLLVAYPPPVAFLPRHHQLLVPDGLGIQHTKEIKTKLDLTHGFQPT
jgi:hypothetical protein